MKESAKHPCSDLEVTTSEEYKWLMSCVHHMPNKPRRIDLLEVYTEPNSTLTQEVNKRGGKAVRFTKEDGDLATYAGQVALEP